MIIINIQSKVIISSDSDKKTTMMQVLPQIILYNISTRKQYKYELENKKMKFITWCDIMEIIELYEPTANLNKILVQAKSLDSWEYITNTFIASLLECPSKFLIRYKLYEQSQLNQALVQKIQAKLSECEKNYAEFQNKFDINNMDVNIFWASPVKGESGKDCINWGICHDYIHEVCQTLVKSKKKVYVSINLLNNQCFRRDDYSIVYLICRTEISKSGIKQSLIGQKRNGRMVKISPQVLCQKLKDKNIQLLIFHTSYPFFHIQQIMQRCPGVKNILLINSNPTYRSDSARFFLQKFFKKLLSCQQIKQSYTESLQQLSQQFPGDQMCCCYHRHDKNECIFNPKVGDFKKYLSTHYRVHKKESKQNPCCDCYIFQISEAEIRERHRVQKKYQFLKLANNGNIRGFDFQIGQIRGDLFYLGSFRAPEGILGNRHILAPLLDVFERQNTNEFRVFNIYNKMCEDKQIFIQCHVNFLIKRKIFSRSIRLQSIQKLKKQHLQKDPQIIYTYFCENLSDQVLKKLQGSQISLLLVSQQKIELGNLNGIHGSSFIKPFNKSECENYIKAVKHLNEGLKNKVDRFIKSIYRQDYSFMYYPSNFNYMSLMEQISKSVYEPQQQVESYIELVRSIKIGNLLHDYIIIMLLLDKKSLPQNKKIRELNVYKKLIQHEKNPANMVQFHEKYFHLVFQQFFTDVVNILPMILQFLVKYTTPKQLLSSYSNKKIAFFEATTSSQNSLISIFFKEQISSCNQLRQNQALVQACSPMSANKLKSILNFINRILVSFYLYEALDFNEEIHKSKMLERERRQREYKREEKKEQKEQPKKNQIKEPNRESNRESNREEKREEKRENEEQKRVQNTEYKKQQKDITIERNNTSQVRERKQIQKNIWNKNKGEEIRKYGKNVKKNLVLAYSLLIINNIIIQRKNTSEFSQFDDKEEIEEILLNSLGSQYRRVSSIGSEVTTCLPYNPSQLDNQIDANVYNEQDFIKSQVNSLNRFSLIETLRKIFEKKPVSKTAIVSQSLSIQLVLQLYYIRESDDESTKNILDNLINSIEFIMKKCEGVQKIAKLRNAFDTMMYLILIGTKCGRQQLTDQYFLNIENKCKKTFEQNFKSKRALLSDYLKQLSQIIKNMCHEDNKYIYEKLKIYLEIYGSSIKDKKEELIYDLEKVMSKWSFYRSKLKKIDHFQAHERNLAYRYIFEMKKETQKIRQNYLSKKKQIKFSKYVESLLIDLDQNINQTLKGLRSRLIVLLVENNDSLVINYNKIMEKQYQNQNRMSSETQIFGNNKVQPLIRAVFYFNRSKMQNIAQLEKIGGCKYLIIEVFQSEPKKILTIFNQLLKLKFQYVFFQAVKGVKLIEEIKQSKIMLKKEQNQIAKNYIAFNTTKLSNMAEIVAFMINLSILMAAQLEQITNNEQFGSEKRSPGLDRSIRQRQKIEVQFRDKTINGNDIKKQILLTSLQKQKVQRIFEAISNPITIKLQQDIINSQYLQAISNTLRTLNTLKQQKSEPNPNAKVRSYKKLNCETFIENFRLFMTLKEGYENFFVFVDQDQEILKLFEDIVLDREGKFFNAYHSDEKMIIIIKNVNRNVKATWMNEIKKELLLMESEKIDATAICLQIGEVQCSIIRRESK